MESIVVRVTGDNPLTDADTMDRMIAAHLAHGAEYTYTDDLPMGTRVEVISVAALRRVHALAEDPSHTEYMTYYLQQPQAVRAHRYHVEDPQLARPSYRLTLDTPHDLCLLQLIYQRLSDHGPVFALGDVTRLLDGAPELVAINAQVQPLHPDGRINTRLRPAVMEARRS